MKVRCLHEYPTPEQLAQLGADLYRHQRFNITVGQKYLGLGLSFYFTSRLTGPGITFEHKDNDGEPTAAPAFLFEVIDPRASKYWELKIDEDGTARLWPPSFYSDFYHDDLSEDVPKVVKDYRQVLARLQEEADGEWNEGQSLGRPGGT
jgi:hypothetical protein